MTPNTSRHFFWFARNKKFLQKNALFMCRAGYRSREVEKWTRGGGGGGGGGVR